MIQDRHHIVCIHESAHCVACCHFHFPLLFTAVEDCSGTTEARLPVDEPEKSFAVAVVALSGGVAEFCVTGMPASTEHAGDDVALAREMLAHSPLLLAYASQSALQLVNEKWPLIQMLAEEISRAGRINQPRLDRLLRG